MDLEGDAEKENDESSIRFPLKGGQVTGLPKDILSAPNEIRLSRTLHERTIEAWMRTLKTGNEWGYFIRFNEEGQLIPSKLSEGTTEEWIMQEDYLEAQKKDKAIRGLVHTHPQGGAIFSHNNLGFFLATDQIIQKCIGPQGDYFLILRTKNTNPPREELDKEITNAYTNLV